MTKVAKFGGSSLADAEHFRKVKDILLADPSRRYVVPSAPGKRNKADEKVTDMLYRLYRATQKGEDTKEIEDAIAARYLEIARELGYPVDMRRVLDETFERIAHTVSPDFTASRGEYLNGVLLAAYLGWDFIDAADIIRFDRQGMFSAEWTNTIAQEELEKHEYAVIPGFYGSYPDGSIRTFSRGGSDITGSVIARASRADVYENWTDVSGFLMADPRIVDDPRSIGHLTYRELRELSYMGATVLHEDAIFPVHKAGIPLNIRNTNDPEHPGTLITNEIAPGEKRPVVTGIAGHKNFTLISIEKAMMNAELGFGRRVLEALEECGVSFEHLPTGIDTMTVVVADSELTGRQNEIVSRIREKCHPDSIEVSGGMALIATVGQGMVRNPGTAARLFSALHASGVNVRMIDQGSSEMNIIVGVDTSDFEKAVRAIYCAFADQ